jgi:hypothetical protein
VVSDPPQDVERIFLLTHRSLVVYKWKVDEGVKLLTPSELCFKCRLTAHKLKSKKVEKHYVSLS